MNNISNDERFFIEDEKKKKFSVKLNEDEYKENFNNSSDYGIYLFEPSFNHDEKVKQELIDRLKRKLEYFKKVFISELKGQVNDSKLHRKLEFNEFMKLIRHYDNCIITMEKEISLKEFGLECLKKKNEEYKKEVKPTT